MDSAQQEAITEKVLEASLIDQRDKGPDLRQLHAKSHGLLIGNLVVEENIPDKCKVGVFAKPQGHDILVRFSNSSSPAKEGEQKGILQPDTIGDARGMSIKIQHVEGETVDSDEAGTQDFVLINHPVFFLPDVQGYIDFAAFKKLMASGEQVPPELLQKLAPSLKIGGEINQKRIGNPLCIEYWSTTPYKLGSSFIKFAVKPHNLEVSPESVTDLPPNYLRSAVVNFLTQQQQTSNFDFYVQFFVDETKTPIEDPMEEWKESDAPFIKVATITILPQEFDSDERKALDESLSFTPWHTLPVHEPVGSINLSRRRIYQEIAKARRQQ
jgi:catalase